jgi:hypothetical protein
MREMKPKAGKKRKEERKGLESPTCMGMDIGCWSRVEGRNLASPSQDGAGREHPGWEGTSEAWSASRCSSPK